MRVQKFHREIFSGRLEIHPVNLSGDWFFVYNNKIVID